MARRTTLGERIRYEFDKAMSAGPIALILWLAVLSILGVAVFVAVVVFAGITPAEGPPLSPVDAAWKALMHVIDSGDVENDSGWPLRAVGIALTIWGIFIVSSLVGLLSADVMQRMEELRKGRSKVLERNHTLILNWSPAVFDIVQQLSVAARESRKKRVVVVMAPNDKVEMEDAIREKVGPHRRLRVICRSGDPTNLSDLRIANVDDAKSVIVVSPEDGGNPDVRNIKTVMALAQAHAATRRIVAEFRDSSNVEAVQVIAAQGIQAVMADDLISRIIVHSSRQSGLSEVYAELLSYEGVEIVTAKRPALAGLTYREALLAFEEGALIGLSIDDKPLLNPPMEMIVPENAEGVFVAHTEASVRPAKKKATVDSQEIVAGRAEAAHAERALILGWNRRGPAVLNELSQYMAQNSVMTVVAESPRFAQLAPTLQLPNAGVQLEHIVADTADRSVIRRLNAAAANHVIVLACSQDMDAESADTQTLVTLLHLRQAIADAGGKQTIVSEILNERNRALAQATHTDDFIVSNRLISMMLTQISENEELLQVFAELLDEKGAEIYLRPAQDYVHVGKEVTFATIVTAAALRDESAFGYRVAGADGATLNLNPRKSATVTFQPGDAIVVLAKGRPV